MIDDLRHFHADGFQRIPENVAEALIWALVAGLVGFDVITAIGARIQ